MEETMRMEAPRAIPAVTQQNNGQSDQQARITRVCIEAPAFLYMTMVAIGAQAARPSLTRKAWDLEAKKAEKAKKIQTHFEKIKTYSSDRGAQKPLFYSKRQR
jgi:hypothetical protein